MKINKSENEIQALFQEKFETRLEKIPESHEKTPDFFGFKNNKKIFVAELKEIENIFPDEKNDYGYQKDELLGGWTKKDNSPAKIGRLIYDAYKQLQKYDHCPKVLILSNKNRSCDHFDLDVALKGFLKSEQGKEFWVAPDVAFGIIKEIKFKIDLYIWVDLIKPIIYEIESGKKISRWRKFYFVHTTKIGKDLAAGLKNRFKSN